MAKNLINTSEWRRGRERKKSGLKGRSNVRVNINYSQERLNKCTYQQLSLQRGVIKRKLETYKIQQKDFKKAACIFKEEFFLPNSKQMSIHLLI